MESMKKKKKNFSSEKKQSLAISKNLEILKKPSNPILVEAKYINSKEQPDRQGWS